MWSASTSTPGAYTHSIRFGYLKTERDLALMQPAAAACHWPTIRSRYRWAIRDLLTGPSGNAARAILQSDLQAKYDGSKTLGRHILRYGFNVNRIAAGGFVPFYSLAPYACSQMLAPPRRPSHKPALSPVAMQIH